LGTTGAFGTGRELGSEIIRTNGRRILGNMGKYDGREYSGQYVQDYR